jgi:two-component system response regulator RegX3
MTAGPLVAGDLDVLEADTTGSDQGPTILFVDHGPPAEHIPHYLAQEGYTVATIRHDDPIETVVRSARPSLVLVRGYDILDRCQLLRNITTVPMLAMPISTTVPDPVDILDVGADGVLPPSTSPRVFIARIRAALRRSPGPGPTPSPVIECGDVRLVVDRHEVTVRGDLLRLPQKEYEILVVLMRHAGTVMSRRRLLEVVWGSSYQGNGKTLDTHIKRLRAKIELDKNNPKHIITVRRVGYSFGG